MQYKSKSITEHTPVGWCFITAKFSCLTSEDKSPVTYLVVLQLSVIRFTFKLPH